MPNVRCLLLILLSDTRRLMSDVWFLLCFTLYSRVNSKYKPPGGLHSEGWFNGGFLRYDFAGLIFGGAYFQNFTVCVSWVGEHMSLGIYVSWVGERISLGICVSWIGEHWVVGIWVFRLRGHISLGICDFLVGEHRSLGICVSWVGEHIFLELCVPLLLR